MTKLIDQSADEEIERLNQMLVEMSKVIEGLLCTAGASLAILGTFCLIYHYKTRPVMAEEMDRARRDERVMISKVNKPLRVLPSFLANRLAVIEHPAGAETIGDSRSREITE